MQRPHEPSRVIVTCPLTTEVISASPASMFSSGRIVELSRRCTLKPSSRSDGSIGIRRIRCDGWLGGPAEEVEYVAAEHLQAVLVSDLGIPVAGPQVLGNLEVPAGLEQILWVWPERSLTAPENAIGTDPEQCLAEPLGCQPRCDLNEVDPRRHGQIDVRVPSGDGE